MKIKVSYQFCTDGDYGLDSPEEFGCTGKDIKLEDYSDDEYDEYADFVGEMIFEDCDSWKCKNNAKSFLQKLLCNGIHVSYTHYYLLEDFYNMIDRSIHFISSSDKGKYCESMGGNQDGTEIRVEFIEED